MSDESGASRRVAWLRLLALVGFVAALDQLSKAAIVNAVDRGEVVEVLPFFDLVHVRNDGIAFGFLGEGSQGAVLAVTLLALIAVIVWFAHNPQRPWSWLAVGLLVGGAAGNLIDRIARDGVVDFIDILAWPSFNVADIAITFGAAALALSAFAVPEDESDPQAGESARRSDAA